ncbi:MAG: DNA polymerase III subunit gamma/tau [Patescibacteria group bacterium]|nr:DNA polymerase III subunit gamma/tau [Patescibacteria group bacterium]
MLKLKNIFMLALYRKYRPKKLSELLGQEHIIEILRNAAKQDKFAHAYLFYGSRGSGKTTTARLLAKLVNCEKRQKDVKFREKGEPCNECRACTEIDSNQAMDVVEIDAASNRGIDEIRDLKESVKLSPFYFSKKVFIIDEVHMLTREAFNALLKTLEEPPAHAVFILATTEYEKLPATISSRTQKFNFKKLAIGDILKQLEIVSREEKIKISADALELIAALGEGSLRDALSLLDQIASMDSSIELKDVERIVGKIGYKKTAELAELLLRGDLESSLSYLSQINEEGYNLPQLGKDMIHYLRRTLSLKLSPGVEELYKKELTADNLALLKKHSDLINSERHINLLKSFIRAYSEMRYSPFPIAPLEVAIIENLKD